MPLDRRLIKHLKSLAAERTKFKQEKGKEYFDETISEQVIPVRLTHAEGTRHAEGTGHATQRGDHAKGTGQIFGTMKRRGTTRR